MSVTTELRRPDALGRRPDDDTKQGLALVAGMAAIMWVVEIIDAAGAHLDDDGIRPRDVDGLVGIATAPFLHSGFGHLIGNTIPFLVLGAAIALSGAARVGLVTLVVALVGGLGVWLTAPEGSVTIGASGLVFGYATYLVARGLYSRRMLHLGGGLLVLAVYGTTLLFGLVPTAGVSWQGHLFGAVGGLVAARLLDRRSAPAVAH
jgi:membrane associated rhomboid family serine protease